MASRARYVDGDTNNITMKPSATHPFEKGDLLFEHPADHTLRTATELANEGAESLNQLKFAEYFVGVAAEKYGLQTGEKSFRMDDVKPPSVLVHTTGRFEFDCPSQIFAPKQPVGIYATSSAVTDSQKVDSLKGAAVLSQAIGLAWPGAAPIQNAVALNRVVVDIQARKPTGSTPVAGTYAGTSGSD